MDKWNDFLAFLLHLPFYYFNKVKNKYIRMCLLLPVIILEIVIIIGLLPILIVTYLIEIWFYKTDKVDGNKIFD